MDQTHESVSNDFAYHPATDPLMAELHENVRSQFRSLAHWLLDNIPPGEARKNAVRKVREGMMWANAGLACDRPRD